MAGVPPVTFSAKDFKDEQSFLKVQDWIDKLTVAVNTQAGLHGPVPVANSLDMKGNTITNLGAPVNPTDAIHLAAATQQFGPAAVAPELQAGGSVPLQTVRWLNSQQQREQTSSFLNDILSLPPTSNTSTMTVVPAGGNTTVTVAAGTYSWSDGSTAPYSQRVDVFANPGVNNFYYYYLRKSDNTVQFSGPFTVNNSANQLTANTDGKGFIGTATINAGGGGTGGGGSDPVGQGGCTEIGTKLWIPEGSESTVTIEPCRVWYEVVFHSGEHEETIAFAAGTLIGMFHRVNDSSVWAARRNGAMGKIVSIHYAERESWKQVVRVKPQGTYWVGAGEWLTHNAKIRS